MLARLKNVKKLLAAAATVAAVYAEVASDGIITNTEAEALVVAGVGLFFTWLVRNEPL